MMIKSDYYADVNPALCSLLLCDFVFHYCTASNDNPTYPMMIIPIPLVLSGDIDSFFVNKREQSDFFVRLNHAPEVLIGLASRIRNSLEITQSALAFSFQNGVLTFDNETKKFVLTEYAQQMLNKRRNSIITKYTKRSTLLGIWLGRINSDSTIYTHLGLHL